MKKVKGILLGLLIVLLGIFAWALLHPVVGIAAAFIGLVEATAAEEPKGKKRLSTGKLILIVLAALVLWKIVSFYGIVYSILHPDWDDITLITSVDVTANDYTEYTEDNGRALMEEALSEIRLGRPSLIGAMSSRMKGVELFTEDGSERLIMVMTGDPGKGYFRAKGEIKIFFDGGEKLAYILSTRDLVRGEKEYQVPPTTEDYDYFWPRYRAEEKIPE